MLQDPVAGTMDTVETLAGVDEGHSLATFLRFGGGRSSAQLFDYLDLKHSSTRLDSIDSLE